MCKLLSLLPLAVALSAISVKAVKGNFSHEDYRKYLGLDCTSELLGSSESCEFHNFDRPAYKLLVRNGLVGNATSMCQTDILINDEKIVKICKSIPSSVAHKVIDATGLLVIPGGIDPHTHLELTFMGASDADNFDSGQLAALSGGTTSHIEFALMGTGTALETVEKWLKYAEGKAHIDYTFHLGITRWDKAVKQELKRVVEMGITSFKIFMAYKGSLMLEDPGILEVMDTVRRIGGTLLVHAESGHLADWMQQYIMKKNMTGPQGHGLGKPALVESLAINQIIGYAHVVNCPLYIVHVSTREGAAHIHRARQAGVLVEGEILSAHLILDEVDTWSEDFLEASAHIMSPPLRDHCYHGRKLKEVLYSGLISVVGSDHAPFVNAVHENGRDNFLHIPNGLNGIEERMTLTWWALMGGYARSCTEIEQTIYTISNADEAHINHPRESEEFSEEETSWNAHRFKKDYESFSPKDYVRVTSTTAAKMFGLYPQKGVLAVGSDADITIFDPFGTTKFSKDTHHSSTDNDAYEGMVARGKVVYTISRGNVMFEKGNLHPHPNRGRFLQRKPFNPYWYDTVAKTAQKRDNYYKSIDMRNRGSPTNTRAQSENTRKTDEL